MNKPELIASVAEKSNLSKKDVEAAVKGFIETVEEANAKGEKVQLQGFGTFEVRTQKGIERECKLPTAKGKPIKTEDKTVPKFTAGKEYKDKVAAGK